MLLINFCRRLKVGLVYPVGNDDLVKNRCCPAGQGRFLGYCCLSSHTSRRLPLMDTGTQVVQHRSCLTGINLHKYLYVPLSSCLFSSMHRSSKACNTRLCGPCKWRRKKTAQGETFSVATHHVHHTDAHEQLQTLHERTTRAGRVEGIEMVGGLCLT